jgi:hypothetical protein
MLFYIRILMQGIKMDEYILGKAKKSSFGDTSEEKEEREDGEEEGEKRKVCSQYLCSFFSLLAVFLLPSVSVWIYHVN